MQNQSARNVYRLALTYSIVLASGALGGQPAQDWQEDLTNVPRKPKAGQALACPNSLFLDGKLIIIPEWDEENENTCLRPTWARSPIRPTGPVRKGNAPRR